MNYEMTEKELSEAFEILEKVGAYIDDITPNTKLDEFILDSMSLISFYIEVEAKYDIFIPEDIYTQKIDTISLGYFWNTVVKALTA